MATCFVRHGRYAETQKHGNSIIMSGFRYADFLCFRVSVFPRVVRLQSLYFFDYSRPSRAGEISAGASDESFNTRSWTIAAVSGASRTPLR